MNANVRTNSSHRLLCKMQFARTTGKSSYFLTNILLTDSGRLEVMSKIKTHSKPEQCTLVDFRYFATQPSKIDAAEPAVP